MVLCRVLGCAGDVSSAAEARNMVDVIVVKDCNKDSMLLVLYDM